MTATNRVSDTHTMTVTVWKDVGTGWVLASAVPVTATKVSGVGNLTVATCTTDGNGQCAVKLFSGTPGTTVVSATATVQVGGLGAIPVETDAKASNSGPAQKTWANAKISIAPVTGNRVSDTHTMTVTVSKDVGALVAASGCQ